MHYVVPFDEYEPELRLQLGGKNASLGELTRAGLPVPPGFAITTTAFTAHLGDPVLSGELTKLLAEADPRRPESVEPVSQAVRALVEAAGLTTDVAGAVAEAYDRLCRRCQADEVAVAVRSSATCEDAPDASFAGEHDSFLWIRGAADVARNVLRCWSSLWTAR